MQPTFYKTLLTPTPQSMAYSLSLWWSTCLYLYDRTKPAGQQSVICAAPLQVSTWETYTHLLQWSKYQYLYNNHSLLNYNLGPVSWRLTTVKWRQFSQSNHHSTIGTRQTEYHETLPLSANMQSHLTSSFADNGNASRYSRLSSAYGGMAVGLWKLSSLNGHRPPWYQPLVSVKPCC